MVKDYEEGGDAEEVSASPFVIVIGVLAIIISFCAMAFSLGATSCKAASMDPLPNTITALVGYGPDGVQITNQGHQVEPFYAPLWGVQFEHRMSPVWSWTVQGMTGVTPQTKTLIGAAGVGWSF